MNPNNPGVYAIVCKATGEKYVGSSRRVRRRLTTHAGRLHLKTHHSKRLQALFDQYGPDAFETFMLAEIFDTDQRFHAEQFYLDSGQFTLNTAKNARACIGKIVDHPDHLPPYVPTGEPERVLLDMSHRRRYNKETKPLRLPNGSKGIFITPWGRFGDPNKAADECPIMMMTGRWIKMACCLSDQTIDTDDRQKSAYLMTEFDQSIIGKPYSDLGFGFIPAL